MMKMKNLLSISKKTARGTNAADMCGVVIFKRNVGYSKKNYL